MKTQKQALREQIKQKRLKQNTSQYNTLSKTSLNTLNNWLEQQQNINHIAIYLAKDTELSLDFWIKAHLNTYQLLCPKKIENKWQWVNLTSLEDISLGPFGIREANNNTIIQSSKIDCFLVPGLAFDVSGNRLGYGKGIYDQLLANSAGIKLGICSENQLLDNIPTEKHDVPMNYILTENKLFVC